MAARESGKSRTDRANVYPPSGLEVHCPSDKGFNQISREMTETMRRAFITLLCVAVMFVVLMNAQLQDSSGSPPRIAAVTYSGESNLAAAVASARRRGDVRDGAMEAADTPSMVLLRGALREEVLRARTALRSWLRELDADYDELQKKDRPTMESSSSSSITMRLETAGAQRRTLGHSLAVVELQQKTIDAQRAIITTMRKSLRSSSSSSSSAEATDPDTALPVQRPRRITPLSWAVEGESAKSGAGLLFFAYGGRKTLQHFVREAQYAAASFREHNPTLHACAHYSAASRLGTLPPRSASTTPPCLLPSSRTTRRSIGASSRRTSCPAPTCSSRARMSRTGVIRSLGRGSSTVLSTLLRSLMTSDCMLMEPLIRSLGSGLRASTILPTLHIKSRGRSTRMW